MIDTVMISLIQMTESGKQASLHFLTGCYKSTTCSSVVLKRKYQIHHTCQLRGDIDYGCALRSVIEFRDLIFNLHIVNGCMSDTFCPTRTLVFVHKNECGSPYWDNEKLGTEGMALYR